ncbi:unnamed protein product, partial [Amoebophrya sp. A120]
KKSRRRRGTESSSTGGSFIDLADYEDAACRSPSSHSCQQNFSCETPKVVKVNKQGGKAGPSCSGGRIDDDHFSTSETTSDSSLAADVEHSPRCTVLSATARNSISKAIRREERKNKSSLLLHQKTTST